MTFSIFLRLTFCIFRVEELEQIRESFQTVVERCSQELGRDVLNEIQIIDGFPSNFECSFENELSMSIDEFSLRKSTVNEFFMEYQSDEKKEQREEEDDEYYEGQEKLGDLMDLLGYSKSYQKREENHSENKEECVLKEPSRPCPVCTTENSRIRCNLSPLQLHVPKNKIHCTNCRQFYCWFCRTICNPKAILNDSHFGDEESLCFGLEFEDSLSHIEALEKKNMTLEDRFDEIRQHKRKRRAKKAAAVATVVVTSPVLVVGGLIYLVLKWDTPSSIIISKTHTHCYLIHKKITLFWNFKNQKREYCSESLGDRCFFNRFFKQQRKLADQRHKTEDA